MLHHKEVTVHKVFISHHHANDQYYKNDLVEFGEKNRIFVDRSVDTGDIGDDLSDESIRKKIRDEYLRDSTVTIVLVGTETKRRKHIDGEIHSSMYDGAVNKRSGVLVINLPTIGSECVEAAHGELEKTLYPDITSWSSFNRAEYERRYPYMPERIIDNLVTPDVKISVVPWSRLNVATLKFLVDVAFRDRNSCKYDLSRPMRRANS